VVVFHARAFAFTYQQKYGLETALLCDFETLNALGGFGVDLFFVISGFVMTYITWNEPRSSSAIWPFLKRRLVRIMPIYWLYTLFLVALGLALPRLFTQTIDIATVILSLLLIPYTPVGANPAPILAVGWTLSFEMYFYGLVALGLLFPRRPFIIGMGIYFIACVTASFFYEFSSPIISLATNTLILEFYFGVLIAVAYMRYGKIDEKIGLCGLVVAIPTLALVTYFNAPFHLRGIIWGVPAAGFVCWFISREQKNMFMRKAIWQKLGASSYTIYLTHCILLAALGRFGYSLGLMPRIPTDFYIILTSAICIAIGHGLFLTVEQPLGRFVSSIFGRRKAKGIYSPALNATDSKS